MALSPTFAVVTSFRVRLIHAIDNVQPAVKWLIANTSLCACTNAEWHAERSEAADGSSPASFRTRSRTVDAQCHAASTPPWPSATSSKCI